MEARTLTERIGFFGGSRRDEGARRPASDPVEHPPLILDEGALLDAAEHEAVLDAVVIEEALRERHSEEIALDTPFIKSPEVVPEGVDVVIERNRNDATIAVPELAALYAAGYLEDASIKHIENDPEKIGRKLLERTFLKLIEYRLADADAVDTFHPANHTRYQLSTANPPHARLAIANAKPVTEMTDRAERTYKRAWVYDPRKREGYRFRASRITAEIIPPSGSIRDKESAVTVVPKEDPPNRAELVKALRCLAESHCITAHAPEADE